MVPWFGYTRFRVLPVQAEADYSPGHTLTPPAGQSAAPAPSSGAAASGSEFIQNQKAPDWTVIQGAQGPQWVYKGWHMVFVRKGEAPGSAAHEGDGNLSWNTMKFVPPVPKVTTSRLGKIQGQVLCCKPGPR